MSKLCTKFNCPNKITIGKETDKDVINKVCSKCEDIFFESDIRKKKVTKSIKLTSIFSLLLLIGLFSWYYYSNTIRTNNTNSKTVIKTPEETLREFFSNINEKKYENAYKSTAHAKWNSLESFKSYLKNWKIGEIKTVKPKSYYTKHKGDIIINVVYNGIEDESLLNKERNYDFLLKKYGNEWRITRILLPKDPETDALKKSEIPSSSVDAVRSFLTFLNQKKYQKAYLLTNNPTWSPKSKFLSEDKGWGCIDMVRIHDVERVRNVNSTLDIVYAEYYASDPCNISKKFSFYFVVSNKSYYWKIIEAKTTI